MAVPAIHPGEHIAEEVRVLDISVAAFARRLKVPASNVTAILDGHVAVTRDVALRLSDFFGTSAEYWLRLQGIYELRLARRNRQWSRLPDSAQDLGQRPNGRGRRK
ncbi:MAG: HigA family addiction module antitoxin [Spirochaetaceae bacterium]|nr:HigA family addiction module antitoxin [Spirochaetaceae bacterium]